MSTSATNPPGTAGLHSTPPAKSFVAKIKAQKTPFLGAFLTIPSVPVAQIAAQADADFIIIDMEHAPLPMDVVTQMVHAYVQASRGTRFPLIRIPSHGVEWVKWALDSGAAGIVVPMVGNAQEMEAILDRAVYPPGGRRSFGPIYAANGHPDGASGGMGAYVERVQRGEIAILPMIESKEGLENVEQILGMDHVAGCFIGPADLRFSLGMAPALDGPEPEFTNAMKKIAETGKRLGKVVGTMGISEDHARKRTAEGMDFLVSTFDNGAMVSGMAQDLSSARQGIKNAAKL